MSQVTSIGNGGGGGIGTDIRTITGNVGGAVGPNLAHNINLIGAGGTTISAGPGPNTLTVTSAGMIWNEVVATTVNFAANNGYIMNNVAGVVGTLPAIAAVGDIIAVVGKGTGGWAIEQNAGQTIHFGNMDTTTGVTGGLSAMNQYDCVELICTTANTDFVVRTVLGNLTVS